MRHRQPTINQARQIGDAATGLQFLGRLLEQAGNEQGLVVLLGILARHIDEQTGDLLIELEEQPANEVAEKPPTYQKAARAVPGGKR